MERWLDRATALLMPLGVVIALLLCLQWPLRELGCEELQGLRIAPPLSEADLQLWAARR